MKMKKIKESILRWWYFHIKNPVIRKGESKDGAFKWTFRRFSLTIETLSGNFKAEYSADEHPYSYLLAGENDDNIIGFAQFIYMLSKTLTTDQGLANDVGKAIGKYQKRLEKQAASEVVEDETEEKIALEQEKQIQEHVELPKKERRKVERRIDGKFKKAVKEAEKHEKQDG
jgi:hypothetical protein